MCSGLGCRAVVIVGDEIKEGGWLARHGTSIRWASLLAWMFGHVHRAMCSDGCQFEVLEEHVCARYVPAYKTDETVVVVVGGGGLARHCTID